MINRTKKSLRHIIASSNVLQSDKPFEEFKEGLLNFHAHYEDNHSSKWCQYHPKVSQKLKFKILNINYNSHVMKANKFWYEHYVSGSHLKHQANQCHKGEKDYMLTWQAVGVGTAFL